MIYQKIQDVIKSAMKSKDTDKRDVFKMAVSKAQAIAKDKKCDVTDAIMLEGIQKEMKQLYQTKDSLKDLQESNLYKSTMYKIGVLEEYLPKMMSEEETEQAVREILEKSNADNKGVAMKLVMPVLKGKADNKLISKYVDAYLKK